MEASPKSETEVNKASKQGAVIELIDTAALIKSDPLNADGYRIRRGSSTLVRQCGRFTVNVTGGFLNGNPGGAEGVYVFPVAAIAHGKAMRFPAITIGRCSADFERFSTTSPCPTHWATSVSAFESTADASPVIHLEHECDDDLKP